MPDYTASHHTKLQLNTHSPPLPQSNCHHHYNKITPQNPLFNKHAAQHLYMQSGTILFPVECVQGKGNGKSAPVHVMQSYRERRFIAPLIHSLPTRWRQVVNFIHQPLYDWVAKPLVPTEQEWFGTVRKPKIVCLCQDWTLDHPSPNPIIMGCDLPTVHVKTARNQLSIQLKSLYDHPTNMMQKELL